MKKLLKNPLFLKLLPFLIILVVVGGLYARRLLPDPSVPSLATANAIDVFPQGLTYDIGSGADGAITVSSAADISSYGADDGNGIRVINATDFTLNASTTLTLNKKITIIRATGTITINGTIDGDARGGSGGVGDTIYPAFASPSGEGPHFYSTWSGYPGGGGGGGGADASGGNGGGGGGGGGSARGTNGGTCAGCYAGMGGSKSHWLDFFLTDTTNDTIMGQGGGSGQKGSSGTSQAGGTGGAGLYIIAKSISLGSSSSITADGANGANGGGTSSGGGGGGGGGMVLLMAQDITANGSGALVTATGGSGGTAAGTGAVGGAGATGYIIAIYLDLLSRTDFGSPTATTYHFQRSALPGLIQY